MNARVPRGPSRWSHQGLERRGYRKCPFCWRHLVKLEEHVAAHEAGRIGADGKRRDRSATEKRAWAERYNGTAATLRNAAEQAAFVRKARYRAVLELAPVDLVELRHELDGATRPEP